MFLALPYWCNVYANKDFLIELKKKASDAEYLCFLWSAPKQTIETIETLVIWDAIAVMMASTKCDLSSQPHLSATLPIAQFALLWRHNERDSVSNHQRLYCLLKLLFRRRSKVTSKLRVTGLCAWNSPGTGEFPAQKASNAETVSIWWRHHGVDHWKFRTWFYDRVHAWTVFVYDKSTINVEFLWTELQYIYEI